jgi:hypothetical protein
VRCLVPSNLNAPGARPVTDVVAHLLEPDEHYRPKAATTSVDYWTSLDIPGEFRSTR